MKKLILTGLILTLSLILTINLYARDLTAMQVRLFYDNDAELYEIRKLQLDEIYHGFGFVDIVTDKIELDQIKALGIENETIHADFTKFLQSRLNDKLDMGGYMTLSEINAYIDSIIAARPDIVSAKTSFSTALIFTAFSTCSRPYVIVASPFPKRFMASSMISVSLTIRSCFAAFKSTPERSAS